MKLLIVSSVFAPEPMVSARTSTDLAEELVSMGGSVRVITTFPNRPAGKLYEGYQRKLWSSERLEHRYQILRVFSFLSAQSRILSRFLENFSFGIASALAVLVLEKPDVVYGNTWPILAQGLLVLVCKHRQIPVVLSVQDLYPESLLVQNRGLKKASRLYRLLRWLDVQTARNCAALIVISNQFRQSYICDRGIAENKITVIPNWITDFPAQSTSNSDEIRMKYDIPRDAFLVVYGGNIGVAAGVESLIDAFQYLIPQENIYLLIAGAGSNMASCLRRIQNHKLKRAKVHTPWETAETIPVLRAADLCVLPTQGEQSLVSVPSKLFTYMMAGRCVLAIASLESEISRIITDSEAGWVVSNNNAETVSGVIREISRISTEERNRRAEAGRNFVVSHYLRNTQLPKLVDLLVQQGGKPT
jgi:glycosyltransferase involved in cell wall biosynthesis